MMRWVICLVACSLLVLGLLLDACVPAVAEPERQTTSGYSANSFGEKDSRRLAEMEAEAITTLNAIRGTLNLPQLVVHRSLTAAAQSHSNFLQANRLAGHYQHHAYPGFTGATPQDRAVFFGYSGTAAEGIAYGTASPRLSVEGLIDAPYHRLGLIDPNDREVGAGFSLEPFSMVVNTGSRGAQTDDRPMRYPYAGQTDAKSAWFVAESPNPLATYHIDRVYVGYPVSLSFHDNKTRELQVFAASITDREGRIIPHYLVDSGRESEAKKHLFLIPHAPLLPGMTYHVNIMGQRLLADGNIRPVSEKWWFATRSGVSLNYLGLVSLAGVDNLELKLKNGDIQDVGYLLIRNGEFVRRYTARQGYSWTNPDRLSAGAYRLQVSAPSVSSDLIEYTIDIRETDGQRSVTVTGETNLGVTPQLRAGLIRLGDREHIELYWQNTNPAASYVLTRDGTVWRSYSADRYYSQQGAILPDGEYELAISGVTGSHRYTLTLSRTNGERRVSLNPAQ